ncbi:MAG: hypothetical protein R3E68_00150 [Burkholderiaceae bacterium]
MIGRDMWLTGFDAPSMHTMYIDKPMRPWPDAGHRPRQPRVPRQAGGSDRGLHRHRPEPEPALAQYSKPDQDKTGIDEAEAVAVLLEKWRTARHLALSLLHGLGRHARRIRL